ncbi:hypothetical protein Avbf_00575 [Armadillidium vulgare]|nr:hypothetical protein Avbf_00575 [Armadillidium vulgare]
MPLGKFVWTSNFAFDYFDHGIFISTFIKEKLNFTEIYRLGLTNPMKYFYRKIIFKSHYFTKCYQNNRIRPDHTQLQELECHLKNMQCTRMKRIMSAAEESYEGHPISMDLSESKDNSDSSIEMENRASCIVDKILEDTKYQLECSESQNKTLVQDISLLTETKNELTIQVDDLNRKLQESKSLSKDLQCNIQEIRKEKQILEIEMQKLEELLKIKDEKINGLSMDLESLSNEKLQEKDNFENLLSSVEEEKKKLELHIEELENVRKDERIKIREQNESRGSRA